MRACGCLPGPQFAGVRHLCPDQYGLGRGIGGFRNQHDLARRCIAVNFHLRARPDGADVRCRNRDLDP